MDEPLTVTLAEASRLLGISERHARNLAARGDLPAIRLGERWVVPRKALERLLETPEAAPMA